MRVIYNLTERKPFVQALAEITGVEAEYLRTPSYAYRVDYFTITRKGNLEFDDMADPAEVEKVLSQLEQRGFYYLEAPQYDSKQPELNPQAEEPLEDCPPPYNQPEETANSAPKGENVGLTVELPLEKVKVGNLTHLLEAKGGLIRKALALDSLPIEVGEDTVSFPWFTQMPDADTVKAYTHFIAALGEMSVKQKRITATEKAVENEKYAFRCFLLRLGFIGSEYKTERKILLRNLSGSAAFKSEARKEGAEDAVSE